MNTFWSINKQKIITWIVLFTSISFIILSVIITLSYFDAKDKDLFIKEGSFYAPPCHGIILFFVPWIAITIDGFCRI